MVGAENYASLDFGIFTSRKEFRQSSHVAVGKRLVRIEEAAEDAGARLHVHDVTPTSGSSAHAVDRPPLGFLFYCRYHHHAAFVLKLNFNLYLLRIDQKAN